MFLFIAVTQDLQNADPYRSSFDSRSRN